MGHQIEHQMTVGNCRLSQCSCGRGALRVKGQVLLLSSADLREIGELFSALGRPGKPAPTPLAKRLEGLTGFAGWKDFTVPQ